MFMKSVLEMQPHLPHEMGFEFTQLDETGITKKYKMRCKCGEFRGLNLTFAAADVKLRMLGATNKVSNQPFPQNWSIKRFISDAK